MENQNKKYEIIYCDPPWKYNNRMVGYTWDNHEKWRDTGAAIDHYPTMTLKEMLKLNIADFCADDCLMFMWTTGPFMGESIDLLRGWGFEYKTVGFVWDKDVNLPGYYTMSRNEFCIIGKKGRIPKPRGARNIRQYYQEKRNKHSAKPYEFRERIEKMFPDQLKLEMFARVKSHGWDIWGNELTNDITIEGER